MDLYTHVRKAVAAGFSGIWIRSYEHNYALTSIINACEKQGWTLQLWDAENDRRTINEAGKIVGGDVKDTPNPAKWLSELKSAEKDEDERVVMTMRNLHVYLGTDGNVRNPALLQILQHVLEAGGNSGLHVIVLSYDGVKIPVELEKLFYVIDHNMPDADEVWQLAVSVATEKNLPVRISPEAETIISSASGLTRLEAAGAFAMSFQEYREVRPGEVWNYKAKILREEGFLELYSNDSGFNELGGLTHLKEFATEMIRSTDTLTKARGVMLLGVPGCGKSQFCKALGTEVGWPTIRLDVGTLMGGLVGQTESQTRRALRSIDAMSPAILMIDEVEKALAGTTGSGNNDSGVGSRILGSLLTWLNDHESQIYTVMTSNDNAKLPAEFTRAGRFDAVFFVDMPQRDQLEQIWQIYIKKYQLTEAQTEKRPDYTNWTGAEIMDCCNKARRLGRTLLDVANTVVPIYHTAKEQIDALRGWAHMRCLSANNPGVYDKNKMNQKVNIEDAPSRPRRRITTTKD